MAGQPIAPRSLLNPVGGTDRINRVNKLISQSLDSIQEWTIAKFEQIPTSQILVNSYYVNKYRYEYQISIAELDQIIRDIQLQLDALPNEYVADQTIGAYEQGTAQAVTNLANISDDYTRNITQVLISDPYQRRAALIGARVFEEMQGFESDTGVALARLLRGAVQDGLNPREVTGQIERQFGISQRRAEKIAQTEITGALRRGRWDEAQDAQERLGIKTKMAWASALKPTTRLTHAQRHGETYTVQQVREFYAVDGNAINCYCSQFEVLVDDDGHPLQTRIIDKMKKQKAEYFGD